MENTIKLDTSTWKKVKLGDICEFKQGKQVALDEQSAEQLDGMKRFIRIIDITQGKEAPRYVYCNEKDNIVDADTIIMVRYGYCGYCTKGYNGVIANNLFTIRPKNIDINTDYLLQYLKTDKVQSKLTGAGAAMKALNFSMLKDIEVDLPTLEEQRKIANALTTLDNLIEARGGAA